MSSLAKDSMNMPIRIPETYTFINRTLKHPNPTGEQLSCIRSHTTKSLQKQWRVQRLKQEISLADRVLQHQRQVHRQVTALLESQDSAGEILFRYRYQCGKDAVGICPAHERSNCDGLEHNDQLLFARDPQLWVRNAIPSISSGD